MRCAQGRKFVSTLFTLLLVSVHMAWTHGPLIYQLMIKQDPKVSAAPRLPGRAGGLVTGGRASEQNGGGGRKDGWTLVTPLDAAICYDKIQTIEICGAQFLDVYEEGEARKARDYEQDIAEMTAEARGGAPGRTETPSEGWSEELPKKKSIFGGVFGKGKRRPLHQVTKMESEP